MRMITLTSALDGAKMYINPQYIQSVSLSRDNKDKTVVVMVGSKNEYFLVEESPDTVTELAQKKDDMPSAQLEPSIPLSWFDKQIERLKGLDNAFATLIALQISGMVKKWSDEQNE